MSFRPTFEKNVNADMVGDKDTEAAASSSSKKSYDFDEAEDEEYDEKKKMKFKNEQHPPRFSTLFQPTKPSPPPSPPPRQIEHHYAEPPRRRRAGIFVPMSVLIIFGTVFLFMGTVVFAYTVIGLYNNAPPRALTAIGLPTNNGALGAAACNCDTASREALNFAPNFILPGGAQQAATTVTVTETTTLSPSPSSSSNDKSTSTSTSTTPSSSTTTTLNPLMSMLLPGPSTTVVVVTPHGPTVQSTTLLTVNAEGQTLAGPSTITSTTVVPAAKRTAVPSELSGLRKVRLEEALAM